MVKTEKCRFCEQIKIIAAKELCRACYGRLQKTGSLEYRKKGIRTICKIENCERQVVGQKLCDMHYRRLKRNGHTDQTRPKDWGSREKHRLYPVWINLIRFRRKQVCESWSKDFWQFVKDVKKHPGEDYLFKPLDEGAELSKINFYWHQKKFDKLKTETEKEYLRRWVRQDRENYPLKYKEQSLRRQFGIGLDEYNVMLKEQKGVCKICNEPEKALTPKTKTVRSLAVDHCHSTNKIRGLLCTHCNHMIGNAKDSIEILKRAIEYLSK